MFLPSTGSLSHQALLMLGSGRKSAKSRGSGEALRRKSVDFREVAPGVRDCQVILTLGQAADKTSGLDGTISHYPPLSLRLRVTFQHTVHRQSAVRPCLYLRHTLGPLPGEANLPVLHIRVLIRFAVRQVDSMICPRIKLRQI